MRSKTLLAIVLAALAAAWGLAASPQNISRPDAGPQGTSGRGATVESANAADAPTRLREGTKLTDQLGYFKVQGDGLVFYTADGKRHFNALENLAMERVARLVSESPDSLEWSVNGVITEFRGANFLLLTQAVVKSKSSGSRTP